MTGWRRAENQAIKQIERRAGNTTLNRNFFNCRLGSSELRASTTLILEHPKGTTQGVCLLRNESEEARARRLAARARYRAENANKIKAYAVAWRTSPEGKASNKASFAAWKVAHPGYMREYVRTPQYREANRIREAARRAIPDVKAALAETRSTPEHKAARARYRQENIAKIKARAARWRARPEVKERARQLAALYRLDPVKYAQRQEKQAAYRQKPEVKAANLLWRRERYAVSHTVKLSRRMSSAVRASLQLRSVRKQKPWNAKWLDLVGYTIEELRAHIERQFLPKMGWHNMPKWHVDHIVPLASFQFTSEDDPAFKAAWALTNLRPIWGPDNLRKGARREFLL